jgi:dephospho-CoA kinase
VPLIGLTGGMGAGKSTALAALERLGAAVLSTDAVVHDLYGSERVREAVLARWGPDLAPGEVVDRAAIAERAFAGDEDRAWLEGLLWPLVGEHIAAWLPTVRARDEGRGPRPRAAVVEAPLLFEAGMDKLCDATIAVIADERLRRSRARGRSHALAEERVARQLSQEEKARRATFAVRNNGTEEDLERALSEVLEKLEE